ncbi:MULTISPECIES: ADP/ATP-dependent (S)-NAD(P)H-hydrate dehydratase [unclassified Microbacterium]|uniref:ADP-dependent NAD(P)H-hydrate dehydratase n=1 Tax=unclassified Microbacterium TaxID=2609290 RepID=UPI000EA99675|nr:MULTISPECIES: ADP/ATP-dependent (S)-NAD(P)H-hydrate dehydratase [unclassified Microbacterium]MBT2485454.1 NAD(P)H-hydrate dehydratase [Microbacterium sp. ISL-108]RKN68249.1 NAD(P)H-hydrate dehydratase [Microbacterium sp. CGR2]
MVEVRAWSQGDAARHFRVPTDDDDKYSRGVVALRTGSSAYPGAAVLGVEAAWRAGAGFVRYVGAERAGDAVLARRPETVVATDIGRTRVDAWVIGSGTDPADRTEIEASALRDILSGSASVIVDAGALDLAPGASAPFLVTPHAREFAKVQERLGLPSSDDDDRTEAAARAAVEIGGVVLVKGARTVIADPAGRIIAVSGATGWLSTAGTGDVLAGVIGAVAAANRGAPLAEVAASAVWLHGHAARIAATALGSAAGHPIVAMDVADALPLAIADVLA